MTKINLSIRNFYDPLYNVITFKRKFWGSESEVIFNNFDEIITTYEFSRLNSIRQEGLTWLEFPSAGHNRFSAALGCWFLAVWAIDNVLITEGSEGSTRLGSGLRARLKKLELLEEFLLASLLSDFWHLPYMFTIENNDFLRTEYKRRQGIPLRHEDIGISLIIGKDHKRENGTNKESVFELYKRFINKQMGRELDNERVTHYLLSKWEKKNEIKLEWIVYLLDPMEPDPVTNMSNEDKKLMSLLRHLISGVVNLGSLDRYNRVSYSLSGSAGELPIRELLHHLSLECQGDKNSLLLFGDGVNHAFQILYIVNISLMETVFRNVNKLSYEVMMNYAINQHWKNIADDNFRNYLPFMEDDELFHILKYSDDQEAKKTIHRIRFKDPFICVGHFCLTENAYMILTEKAIGDLCNDEDLLKNLQDQRRQRALSHFKEFVKEFEDQWFIRFAEAFGTPSKEETTNYAKKWKPRPEWMDPDKIAVDQGRGHYTSLSEVGEYKKIVELLQDQGSRRRREFWLFIKEDDPILKKRIRQSMVELGAHQW